MTSLRRSPLLLLALAALALPGCGGDDGAEAADVGSTIAAVAPSTAQPLYEDLIAAFARTEAGRGVHVRPTYGPSSTDAFRVTRSVRAEAVTFTDELAMQRVVDAGVVAPDWHETTTRGVTASSTIAFVVRPGNPLGIRTWRDLLGDDVRIVLADPKRSGLGLSALLAAFAQAEARDGRRSAGTSYVRELLAHVDKQSETDLRALDDFTAGRADVLLTDRATAEEAKRAGAELDIVDPDPTFRVDYVSAPTLDATSQGISFAEFLVSPEADRIARDHGYSAEPPGGGRVLTVDALGGWPEVQKLLDAGVIPR